MPQVGSVKQGKHSAALPGMTLDKNGLPAIFGVAVRRHDHLDRKENINLGCAPAGEWDACTNNMHIATLKKKHRAL